jgi:hypothetical protein
MTPTPTGTSNVAQFSGLVLEEEEESGSELETGASSANKMGATVHDEGAGACLGRCV